MRVTDESSGCFRPSSSTRLQLGVAQQLDAARRCFKHVILFLRFHHLPFMSCSGIVATSTFVCLQQSLPRAFTGAEQVQARRGCRRWGAGAAPSFLDTVQKHY